MTGGAGWTSDRYQVRGLPLAYHLRGDPKDRALICLHGFLDHGMAFRFVVEALSEPAFVIAPDLRGHGHSGWVGDGGYYHFYDYFDDVRALVDRLGLERFSVLGHSMGGSVAFGVAALFGERVERVVLLEGMGPPFDDLNSSVDRLQRWTEALRLPAFDVDVATRSRGRKPMADLTVAAEKLRSTNPRLTPARALVLAESFTEPSAQGPGVVWRFDPLHRTPAAKPFVEAEALTLWRAIKAPVLSLYGLDSGWRPDRLSERHQSVARLVPGVVTGAGHNIHHDRPELVAAALEAFWADPDRPQLPPGVAIGEP